MSSRFGDMLLNRRRQLGMSIQQVANVIKIRPQIIEYFETANFAAMPPRGYAQGMIASYARYLGLNPREVVDAYFDELATYERVHNTGAGRFQESVAEASPHSENTAGRFMMVDAVPVSRYGQRPPQAGYVSESHSPHEPLPVARMRREPMGPRGYQGGTRALPPTGRGAGAPGPAGGPRPYDPGRQRPMRSGQGRPHPQGAPGGLARQQRPGAPAPRGYAARSGRPGSAQRPGAPRSGRAAAPSGPFGSLDPRIVYGGIAVIILLLIIIALATFRGCSATGDKDAARGSAPASQTAQPDAGTDDDSSADSDADADSDSDADADAQDQSAADGSQDGADASQNAVPTEYKVKISIAKGKTSWVEIKLDGKGEFADTVVGPFSKEYTVTQAIEISVTNPADVSITKNGEKVRYDSKSSGVGRVTITVPKQDPVDADGDGQPDAATTPEQAATDPGADADQAASA